MSLTEESTDSEWCRNRKLRSMSCHSVRHAEKGNKINIAGHRSVQRETVCINIMLLTVVADRLVPLNTILFVVCAKIILSCNGI
jgi:hypothetical protein